MDKEEINSPKLTGNDEADLDAIRAAEKRREYEMAVNNVVKRLSPKDFEHLIDSGSTK